MPRKAKPKGSTAPASPATVMASLEKSRMSKSLVWMGAIAAAIVAMIAVYNAVVPPMVAWYTSDAPPFEGRAQHNADIAAVQKQYTSDMEMRLKPISDAVEKTVDTLKTVQAAQENYSLKMESLFLENDQRSLCAAADQLRSVELRLSKDPGDDLAMGNRQQLTIEIARRRKEIMDKGAVPNC